jgi:hypothetical protein
MDFWSSRRNQFCYGLLELPEPNFLNLLFRVVQLSTADILNAMTIVAALVSDLRRFDLLSAVWTNVTGQITGPNPTARYLPAFASLSGKLYLFGGADAADGKL